MIQNICRWCSQYLDSTNPYNACPSCSKNKGRELREEFVFNKNGKVIHYKVCQRCTFIYDNARQHICVQGPIKRPDPNDRDSEIEYLIKGANYSSKLLKMMWDEIVDLRSRLDMREIEDDIVPEMKRWEEELGGDL